MEDVKPSMRIDPHSPLNYPTHSPFVENNPIMQCGTGPVFHKTVPPAVTSPYTPCDSAPSSDGIDVSRIKQEPGFHSNFPADRRTVSMDSPYPFHIKKELNPMYLHDNVRRQMSMPLNPSLRSPINLENRRSSEPVINPAPFPQAHPYPGHLTPDAPPMPYPGIPSQLACPTNQMDSQQRQDLYLVNLATYHHHQEMETIKRRKLTKGKFKFMQDFKKKQDC